MKTSYILSALLAFTLTFQACSNEKQVEEDTNSMVSTNEYVLTALDKQQFVVKKELDGFVLENAKGKVVIFDIFATWCPPCRAAASHLSSLQKKYKDDLVVIGITIEDTIANQKLQEFKAQYNAQYILVNSVENSRIVDAIASSLKVGERFAIPLMAMYKDGKLINHYMGATEEEFIESDIKQALGK
jgi:thiol-disulfide isomerase/thioredoxin